MDGVLKVLVYLRSGQELRKRLETQRNKVLINLTDSPDVDAAAGCSQVQQRAAAIYGSPQSMSLRVIYRPHHRKIRVDSSA